MSWTGRITKVERGRVESVLQSALVIAYESSWGLNFSHPSVVHYKLRLDENVDLELCNRNCTRQILRSL